jgi:5-dehydro-4-deoxyglucarate dehydratase
MSMTMSPNELRAKLQGVVGFPVTPFKADLSLDVEGLRRNLRAMLQHPPAAIVAAGGTGELYSLAPAEHLAVVRAAVEEAGSTVPVIAGVGFNGAIAAELARQAAGAGASGILAFPPYYPGGEDEDLLAYYQSIGAATGLGLIIYSRDWFHPSAALVERLAGIPTLIAWKDGQGDIRRLQILRARVGDRLHWIGGAGDDLVPAYYGIGLRAFTSSIANASSKVALQLHDTASRGDAVALQSLMSTYVVPIYVLRAKRRGYEVSVMKSLMDLLGLAGGPVRPPLANLRPDEVEALRSSVAGWRTV